MGVTKTEIDSFHQFAETKLQEGAEDLTLETLLDLWRIENPDPEQRDEDLRLLREALREVENGDRGIPFDEHIAQVRSKFNLPPTNET